MSLKEEFADLPMLAIKCCLDKPGTVWLDGQASKFEELVLDQELIVIFVEKHDQLWQVTLSSGKSSILQSIKEVESVTNKALTDETGSAISLVKSTIEINSTCQAYVSHMEGPGEFYIQMCSSTDNLESLSSRLNDAYS